MTDNQDFPTKDFRRLLLSWYDQNKRDLPFRKTRDPYKIWLSEIMLQQTTVATVIDYYQRFIQKFPNPGAVAATDDSELLTLWQGLGYYSRARNFKKSCDIINREFGGKLPQDFEKLRKLPGIGDYTAAAVASIAFNLPHAVIDGNVQRVLTRIFAYAKPVESKDAKMFFRQWSDHLLSRHRPGDFNQAMMELGAVICKPRNPLCSTCPVHTLCKAKMMDPETFPNKRKMQYVEKNYAALLLTQNNSILLQKPDSYSLVTGLWEIPLYELHDASLKTANPQPTRKWERLGAVKHGITNKRITATVYRINSRLRPKNGQTFIPISKLQEIPIGTLTRKILGKFL